MKILKGGSLPSRAGPADYFTGQVRQDMPFEAEAPGRSGGVTVTFEPGARTNWHTHPLGQTLIVTAGCGWARNEGGPRQEISPGDVIRIAAGERHWHGATATTAMTHIAIAEAIDGSRVNWAEPVSDADYLND